MLAEDGKTTFKTPEGIMDRWHEPFRDLFYNPSRVDDTALDTTPRGDIHDGLDTVPTVDEVVACIKQVNTGKAPGIDRIPVELLLHGATNVHKAVFNFILSGWNDGPTSQD